MYMYTIYIVQYMYVPFKRNMSNIKYMYTYVHTLYTRAYRTWEPATLAYVVQSIVENALSIVPHTKD